MSERVPTSRTVKLKPKPTITEPLGSYDQGGDDLDLREQELEIDENAFRSQPKSKRGLTGGQIALIIIIIVIIIAAILVAIFFLTQNTFNPGTSNFANVGQDCTSMQCASPLVCEGGICRGPLGSQCFGSNCATGLSCCNGQCRGAIFSRCTTNTDCCSGLICSQATCITAP